MELWNLEFRLFECSKCGQQFMVVEGLKPEVCPFNCREFMLYDKGIVYVKLNVIE